MGHSDTKKHKGRWVSVDHRLPEEDGVYLCQLTRMGEVIVAEKILRKGRWMGGCRPFASDDVVMTWWESQ